MGERVLSRWHGLDDDANQFGDRTGLEFLHDQLTVRFGCAGADTEFFSNHLGQFAFEDSLQHFLFARRQQGDPLAHASIASLQFGPLAIDAQAILDAFDQLLRGKRLLEKIECPAAHCAHHRLNLGISGNEDHRQIDAAPAQFILQFQPAHARHAQVADDTTFKSFQILLEEFHRVFEDYVGQVDRFGQVDEQEGYDRIIVDQSPEHARKLVLIDSPGLVEEAGKVAERVSVWCDDLRARRGVPSALSNFYQATPE